MFMLFFVGGGGVIIRMFVFWEGYIIHINDFLLGGGVTIHIFMFFL